MMTSSNFKDSVRTQQSVLSLWERRVLLFVAKRTPAQINSDHFTILGSLAMLLAGVFYALSSQHLGFLHLVNVCLALNWFGDSMDGTLARFRNQQRPRFGYYVDHLLDCFGMFFLLAGLGLSGLMTFPIALLVAISFLLMSINVYLTAYTLGSFQLSYGLLSPTELRILVAVGNLVVLVHPTSHILGHAFLLFDVSGVIAALVMLGVLLFSAFKNLKRLYRLERL